MVPRHKAGMDFFGPHTEEVSFLPDLSSGRRNIIIAIKMKIEIVGSGG